MIEDLRQAFRAAVKHPGYFAAALLTLAAAIGFNTAVFTVVNAVLLRPLPYRDADRLVVLRERRLPQFPEFSLSPGHFLTWSARATTFEGMAAHGLVNANIDAGQELERVRGDRVSTNFFDVLGVRPALGRGFVAEDDGPGANAVILSHQLWQRRFAGDAAVVGRTIRLSETSRTVVGVMPAGFHYPARASEFWVPLALTEQERRSYSGNHFLGAVGRLRPGVPIERAREDLHRVARQLAVERRENVGWEPLAFPMHDYAVRDVKRPLLVTLGAVGFVLLIACVNVANLLLARGAARRKEFAIRGALGAGRGRLVRQLAAENLLLGLSGAAAGVLVGAWLLRALLAVVPPGLPRATEIGLDTDVYLFTLLLSIVTPLIFGFVPVIYGSRADLRDALSTGGRHSGAAPTRAIRTALVVSEIALALVLLTGAGLLIRSFAQLQQVPLGFQPEGVVIGGIALPAADYPSADSRVAFLDRLRERLAALPHVQAVGLSQSLPIVNDFVASFVIEGAPPIESLDRPRTNFYAVTPGYLEAMGIPVIQGRALTQDDTRNSPAVVLINETLARRFFADQNPIGQRIRISQGPDYGPREIVGVVADVKQYGPEEAAPTQVYEPYSRHAYLSSLSLAVRTRTGDPAGLAPAIRAIVRNLDKNQAVARIRTMTEVVDAEMSERRFSTLLLGIFGGAAVGFAAVGLYAVLAYSVSQRRHEIAIRIAHGATRTDVVRMVLQGGLTMVGAGIVVGLLGAVLLQHLIEAMLFNVRPGDPVTYVSVTVLLIVVALLAAIVPAVRATRVDPMIALRES